MWNALSEASEGNTEVRGWWKDLTSHRVGKSVKLLVVMRITFIYLHYVYGYVSRIYMYMQIYISNR